MAAWAGCTKKILWNVCSLPIHSKLGVASTFGRDCERDEEIAAFVLILGKVCQLKCSKGVLLDCTNSGMPH